LRVDKVAQAAKTQQRNDQHPDHSARDKGAPQESNESDGGYKGNKSKKR